MIHDALYIAARAPRPGLAKTRLGRALGHLQAVGLYTGFLRDLANRFATAPFAVGWYVTPLDAWDDLQPLVGPPSRFSRVLVQGDGDWTDRQVGLFQDAPSRGERRTVLMASDSPQVEMSVVQDAFARLDRDDLALGPTVDGGYYLIGMRAPWSRCPWDVLRGVAMSTGTVRDEVVGRARALGLSIGLLPTTFDVDEVDDLRHLAPLAARRPDLAATRAELAGLAELAALGELGPPDGTSGLGRIFERAAAAEPDWLVRTGR